MEDQTRAEDMILDMIIQGIALIKSDYVISLENLQTLEKSATHFAETINQRIEYIIKEQEKASCKIIDVGEFINQSVNKTNGGQI
jgi:hypothetical protein